MARLTVAAVFGVLVGALGGAACGIHADDRVGDIAEPAEFPEPEVVAEPVPAFGVWDRLAQCESSGRWDANTGNGYYGGVQFDLGSWRAAGGMGLPHLASRATQIAVAQRWLSLVGWGAWQACSRRLGLR